MPRSTLLGPDCFLELRKVAGWHLWAPLTPFEAPNAILSRLLVSYVTLARLDARGGHTSQLVQHQRPDSARGTTVTLAVASASPSHPQDAFWDD